MSSRFDRVSPSSLPTLEQCRRAWAIQRDYGKARKAHPDLPDDPPTYKMVFGTIFHKAVEKTAKSVRALRKITKDVLAENAEPVKFDDYYPDAKSLAEGVGTALKGFLGDAASEPWKNRKGAALEKDYETEIAGMPMYGIVDCIDGNGIVRDLKTTASNNIWHGSQLAAYWRLAADNKHKVESQACVVKVWRPRRPDGNTSTTEQYMDAKANQRHVERLAETAKRMRDDMPRWEKDYTAIEINPSAGRCAYCPARGTSACPERRTW